MPYVAPTTVSTGDVYQASAHNVIVNDIIDHETRLADVGLWHVHTETFTTASATNINNVFTSVYANYKIVVDISTASADAFTYIQMRAGSSSTATGYYWAYDGRTSGNTADAGFSTGTGNNSFECVYVNNGRSGQGTFDLIAPQLARNTLMQGMTVRSSSATAAVYLSFGGSLNDTTQYDGLTIGRISGTHTGSIRIYGYQNT